MNRKILISIIKDIKSNNDNRANGDVMADDETNEDINDILKKYELTDDQELLAEIFGSDGLNEIRDAEAGIYHG